MFSHYKPSVAKLSLLPIIMLTSSCAITEFVVITGGSYLISGKSLADNVVSVVTDSDCKAHNLLFDKPICESTAGELLAQTTENNDVTEIPSSEVLEISDLVSFEDVAVAPDTTPVETTRITETVKTEPATELLVLPSEPVSSESINNVIPQTEYTPSHGIYAVVGSFEQIVYAKYRQYLYEGFEPLISQHSQYGDTRYRVIIGPLEDPEQVNAIPSRKDTETAAPWLIQLCNDDLTPLPCKSSFVAQR